MNAPTHIGQYRVVRTLAAGDRGVVYLGEHVLLECRASIKALAPALARDREVVEPIFDEARAMSSISDPGVVQVYDFGYDDDGTAYVAMEYLEAESLRSRIARLGKLPARHALNIARSIAQSLIAATTAGIL